MKFPFKKSIRKMKEYQSKWLDDILKFVMVICIAIYFFSLIVQNEPRMASINLVIVPFLMLMLTSMVSQRLHSDTTVDIKIYDYQKLLSMDIDVVWASSEHTTCEREKLSFLEIQNIGETSISNTQIILNHINPIKNTIYEIRFPYHRNDRIYLALPIAFLQESMNTVSIIYKSKGADEAKLFRGDIIDTGEYRTFSEISIANELNPKKNTKISCVRMALKQAYLEVEEQLEKSVVTP